MVARISYNATNYKQFSNNSALKYSSERNLTQHLAMPPNTPYQYDPLHE